MTVGSYRRGKSSCGDVDILIAPPPGCEDVDVLSQLIATLESSGFLTDHLSIPGRHVVGRKDGYMGVCRLPGPDRIHRRLDIKVYPKSQYAFALLYFTGSDHFNRSMRCFARVTGLSLSDTGLFSGVIRGPDDKKLTKGRLIVCDTEEAIFAALGMEYREPNERNCFDVAFLDDDREDER